MSLGQLSPNPPTSSRSCPSSSDILADVPLALLAPLFKLNYECCRRTGWRSLGAMREEARMKASLGTAPKS